MAFSQNTFYFWLGAKMALGQTWLANMKELSTRISNLVLTQMVIGTWMTFIQNRAELARENKGSMGIREIITI